MRGKSQLSILVKKYLQGKCSEEEMYLLWRWIWQLDISKDKPAMDKSEEVFIQDDLHYKIMKYVTDRTAHIVRIRSYKKNILSAAAILSGLILIIGILWETKSITGKDNDEVVTIFSNRQHVKKILLPDSTEVVLNSSSSLAYYPQKYGETERKVLLKGEGYFKVHKDSLHPFIVQTGTLITRALGTEFDIESCNGENDIRVSLLHGKVSVRNLSANQYPVILYPGQMVSYKKDQNYISIPIKIGVVDAAAWIKGDLVFNNVPLDEAIRKIQNHYGLIIRFNNNQVKGKYVTAVFNNSISWQSVLSSILFVNRLQYSSEENLVIIKK